MSIYTSIGSQLPSNLYLTASHLLELHCHIQEGSPEEVCGILAGMGERVQAVFPLPNVATDRLSGFVADRTALHRVLNLIRKYEWQWLATYHSHPSGAPLLLSSTDLIAAQSHPGVKIQIVGGVDAATGRVLMGAFVITSDKATQIPIFTLDP